MKIDLYLKKSLTSSWFAQLQETIRYEFEKIEIDYGKKNRQKPKKFKKNVWKKSSKKNETRKSSKPVFRSILLQNRFNF